LESYLRAQDQVFYYSWVPACVGMTDEMNSRRAFAATKRHPPDGLGMNPSHVASNGRVTQPIDPAARPVRRDMAKLVAGYSER
jgi:hypothetical protein